MRRRVAIALLTLFFAVGLVGAWWWRWRQVEHSQDERIQVAAQRYGVDPALVKAVIWRESRFNPSAVGAAGELGLMQLQASAAQEWADAEGIVGFRHEHCLDASTNILAGTFYLGKLLKRYSQTDNPVPYALADYNAGRSNVLKWLDGAGETNSAMFIQHITFPGTQNYVIQIMKRSERY